MTRAGQRWPDAQSCGTDAAYTAHLRRGERPCYACHQADARRRAERQGRDYIAIFDPRQVRNGMPEFRPYVYRGTGVDEITGCRSSYGKGCRCEDCREQHTRRQARVRAELAAQPREQVPHGVGGYGNWGCRCEVCTAANTAACTGRRVTP